MLAALQVQRGALASLTLSFEANDQYDSTLLVHGTEGTLELPDANAFDGDVRVRIGRGDWETVPYVSRGPQDTRGIGLHEMIEALQAGRPHRASGELGLHVLETASAVLDAASRGEAVKVESRVIQETVSTR